MKQPHIKIKANYSFWKYPIKWIKEYKTRKVLELLYNNHWEKNKENVFNSIKHRLIHGHDFMYTKNSHDGTEDAERICTKCGISE